MRKRYSATFKAETALQALKELETIAQIAATARSASDPDQPVESSGAEGTPESLHG